MNEREKEDRKESQTVGERNSDRNRDRDVQEGGKTAVRCDFTGATGDVAGEMG